MSQREARREFRFQDGKSDKFWAIALDGNAYTVQFGRTGTQGRTQTKELATPAAARAAYDKLIAEKTNKGYAELAGGGAAPAASAPAKASPKAAGKASKAKATSAKGGAKKKARAGSDDAADDDEPAAAPGPASTAPRTLAAASTSRERRLGLAAEDYLFATWRRTPAQALPAPRPFDLADCLARLRRIKVPKYGWQWDWSPARLEVDASPEEAGFWVHVISQAHREKRPADLAAELEQRKLKPVEPGAARKVFKVEKGTGRSQATILTANGLRLAADMLAPVVALLGPADAAELAVELISTGPEEELLEGLRRFVLPYLEPAAREALAGRVKAKLDPTTFPQDFYAQPAGAFHLAALLGAPSELLALVESWPDGRYDPAGHGWEVDHYHAPQRVIFGLASPDLVVHHLRRLKLPLRTPTHLRAFLAHTEVADLEWAAEAVAKKANKDDAAALMAALTAVEAPELAPFMLDLLGSKAPKQAREWLNTHPGHVAFGLVELAAGKGKRAAAALEQLRGLKRQGHEALLREAVAAASPEAGRRVTAEVLEHEEKVYPPLTDDLPGWLRDGLAAAAALERVKPPAWVAPADLPPLVLGERRLADEHVAELLRVLQKAPLAGGPAAEQPLIAGLRAHAEARSRGAFAWRLFERWLSEGAPSKEKWALETVGHLGDDVCALELAPLIRAWPGESQHQRAVLGLEVLRTIGSDTALMQINGIATKLKFKGLKTRAAECMEAIAKARGMSRAELEDRIVPDCDLEPDGSRVFDFGPRRFTFALGPDLKPLVRDEQGKLKKDLPKPGAKDDPALAAAAVEAWGLLKKQLRDVLKIQPDRLEQAMVTGRRWKAGDFERLLVHHPLMTHLVRLLLWGDYPAGGGAPRPFRVSEERELLDADDEPVQLTGEVGLVHPLELDAATRARWGEVFADYQLLSPFPQLGREVHRIEPKEAKEKQLTRLAGRRIAAATLVGTLERLGWTRGTPQDAGVFSEHSKQFPGANVTAVLQYESGVPVGYMTDWEDQEVTAVLFLAGLKSPDACSWIRPGEAVALGEVAPIVHSEVLRDLGVLEGKAR